MAVSTSKKNSQVRAKSGYLTGVFGCLCPWGNGRVMRHPRRVMGENKSEIPYIWWFKGAVPLFTYQKDG